jgi:small-conductance mechanosensitive channel
LKSVAGASFLRTIDTMQTEAIRAGRPHVVRAVAAGIVALAGAVVGSLGQVKDVGTDEATEADRLLAFIGAALLLVAGLAAVRASGTAIRRAAAAQGADARGSTTALITSVVGYTIVALGTLGVLDVDLGGLLLGGAVTGVVIGIAAQQTIGNFFAGIVLMVAKPFIVGDEIVIRSGTLGGDYDGRIVDMSMFYVTMLTAQGDVKLPNSGVLAAAVGPGARKPPGYE